MIDISSLLPAPKQWSKLAACAGDPERMFPENIEPRIRDAKAVCADCPVVMACLQDALRTGDNDYGIRGGLKPGERRAVAKLVGDRRDDEQAVAAAVEQVLHPVTATRTLREVFEEQTERTADGHLKWTGSTTFTWRGHSYAPKRTSFFLHRGREPRGIVRRTPACPVVECVHPMHLEDNVDRHRRIENDRRAKELAKLRRAAA
jgi:hypothetical protein